MQLLGTTQFKGAWSFPVDRSQPSRVFLSHHGA